MRDEANRLGISVDEVGRLLPQFPQYGGPVELGNGQCVRYGYPRAGSTSRQCWALLQRDSESGGTLPNGYALQHEWPLSHELTMALQRVAKEFDEEFFEFEGTSDRVYVYWKEWGGIEKVRKLHELMERLARL